MVWSVDDTFTIGIGFDLAGAVLLGRACSARPGVSVIDVSLVYDRLDGVGYRHVRVDRMRVIASL
jgi:hypothetical protein